MKRRIAYSDDHSGMFFLVLEQNGHYSFAVYTLSDGLIGEMVKAPEELYNDYTICLLDAKDWIDEKAK